ncbi:hypothetical protein R1sor_014162 [Riccia sorocarpa]|uniref:Uncharacterized protein n=1 Tax=Riccia sorocarpa TaxID=122646 RepID=A0ABD3H8U3_9MARC
MASQLAVAGKHYDIYRQSKYGFIYVCLVGDCPRNARNMERFKPHMVMDHGFTSLDQEADGVRMQHNGPNIEKEVATCHVEAEKSAKFHYDPKPEPGPENIFTILLDGMLLLDKWMDTGFWRERGDYQLQEQVLNEFVCKQPLLCGVKHWWTT